jgi:hypothetical protein
MPKTKMDQKLKSKWVAALLSGDYKQTSNKLREGNGSGGYCCIGVLCDISKLGEWGGHDTYNYQDSRSMTGVPLAMMPRVGITQDVEDKLTRYNDSGKTFKWIAGYIKRYL